MSGGCIASSWWFPCPEGPLLVKYLADAPAGLFTAEAAGLAALTATSSVTTPAVRAVGPHFICLEYLMPSPWKPTSWIQLGIELAQLHATPQTQFGFPTDTFCGSNRQPNQPMADGHLFFSEQRLLHQGQLALHNGRLGPADLKGLESLCHRLPELIPDQSPALIHGDLWSGNLLCHQGRPVLIDPACYVGWAEAELAMTTLFGRFDDRFYRAYEEAGTVDSDWRERCNIYNLYHLLNHLNLFGSSYYSNVRDLIERYR